MASMLASSCCPYTSCWASEQLILQLLPAVSVPTYWAASVPWAAAAALVLATGLLYHLYQY